MTLDELRALAVESRDGYPAWGDPYSMSPTLSECEFLHAYIAAARPKEILELGTGMGVSTRFLAAAAAQYGGHVTTVERDGHFLDAALALLVGLTNVSLVGEVPGSEYDLVYVDSAVNWRSSDLVHWLGYKPGPTVILHDAYRTWPELGMGEGIFVPSQAGFWIGRGK